MPSSSPQPAPPSEAPPARTRLLAPALVTALATTIATLNGKLFTDSDTTHYLHLAAGEPVMQPFAARQLGPLVVRALTHLGLTIHQGFWLLGIASLLFFVATVTHLLEQANSPAWLRWSILGMYFWAVQFGGMVLPDLFYAALLSGFLLLLHARRYTWAAATLLPLMAARESTILVLLCWLYVAWRTLTWGKRILSVAAVASGAAIVHLLATASGGNREGLPPALYLLGKMPWNFAKNFLGIDAWANLNQLCGTPVWHRAVHFGPLRDIGYCSVSPDYPMRLVACALATFGLLPLLLWRLRKVPQANLLTRFCLVYGVTGYLIAGLLGYSVNRLFAYGWPAFLVALPFLLGKARFQNTRWAATFVALHLTASWLPWRVPWWHLFAPEFVLWIAGVILLHKRWIPENAPENAIIGA